MTGTRRARLVIRHRDLSRVRRIARREGVWPGTIAKRMLAEVGPIVGPPALVFKFGPLR